MGQGQAEQTVCSDACESVWPLVLVKSTPTAGPGVSAALLGAIPVSDASKQRELPDNGHPLYRFTPDAKPADVKGQGNTTFGAPWWLVSPAVNAITRTS